MTGLSKIRERAAMMLASKRVRMWWLFFGSLFICAVTVLLTASPNAVSGVQEVDEIRDLTRTSWKSKRPLASRQISAEGPATKYKITRRMPRDATISSAAEDSEIGLTLWRLRPAKTDDAIEIRDLIQHSSGPKEEWTPERVASDTQFHEGQLVRLSIESLRTGFLYVIDRARYQDGTYGDPYLIFPTRRIYGGDNRVEAGRAIQIPGPAEPPFTLERGKTKVGELQESEELIILVLPQPFERFPIAPTDRQKLSEQSVESLIRRYAAPFEISENIGGAGSTMTVAEKRAAKTASERLGAENPYPQTIYRLSVRAGEPLLVIMRLRVVDKN